ncbi:unnamed protein product, partial [Ectocarpus sp. 8 AP-2014]
IFGFLGAGCLQRASGACRAWRDAAVDEQLWKELCLRRWVGKHVGAVLWGPAWKLSYLRREREDLCFRSVADA